MSYPNVTFWRLKVLFWNSLWLFGDVIQVGLFLQCEGHCSVTHHTLVSVSLILHSFCCSCGVSDFSVDERFWMCGNKIGQRSMFWGYLEKPSDQNLGGKLFGSSFVLDFFISTTGALPPFTNAEGSRLVLKHTLTLSLSQQAWSRHSSALWLPLQ